VLFGRRQLFPEVHYIVVSRMKVNEIPLESKRIRFKRKRPAVRRMNRLWPEATGKRNYHKSVLASYKKHER
jgi:hypothetical protein